MQVLPDGGAGTQVEASIQICGRAAIRGLVRFVVAGQFLDASGNKTAHRDLPLRC